MSVRVHVSEKTNVASISPTGPLTGGRQMQQLSLLSQSLLDKGAKTLQINMAGVSWIDSYGLGFLVALNARAASQSVRMVVMNPREEAMRSLGVGAWILPFEVMREQNTAVA